MKNLLDALDNWIYKYFVIDFTGWHHLYTGIILMIVSMWWGGCLLFAIGFWLALDDIGQHRLKKVQQDMTYQSYGHYIGKPLYRLRQWLVKKYGWNWLNKI